MSAMKCPACGRDYDPQAPAPQIPLNGFPCVGCGRDLFEVRHPRKCRCETCKRQSAGMFADDLAPAHPELF